MFFLERKGNGNKRNLRFGWVFLRRGQNTWRGGDVRRSIITVKVIYSIDFGDDKLL